MMMYGSLSPSILNYFWLYAHRHDQDFIIMLLNFMDKLFAQLSLKSASKTRKLRSREIKSDTNDLCHITQFLSRWKVLGSRTMLMTKYWSLLLLNSIKKKHTYLVSHSDNHVV